MITKQHNARLNQSEIIVTLELFDSYEDVERLKKSLSFCVKTLALSKDLCGGIPEIWDVCTLIESLSLTENQSLKVNKLLFP